MPTSVTEFSGEKTGRGTDNEVPFVAGRPGYPRRASCPLRLPEPPAADPPSGGGVRRQPHRTAGRRCLRRTALLHGHHSHRRRSREFHHNASMKLTQFKAINTLLGNLKTDVTGTYHAFKFVK